MSRLAKSTIDEIKLSVSEALHDDGRVASHEEFINGNGSEGAKVQLARMQEHIKAIRERVKRQDTMLWALILLVIGQAISEWVTR